MANPTDILLFHKSRKLEAGAHDGGDHAGGRKKRGGMEHKEDMAGTLDRSDVRGGCLYGVVCAVCGAVFWLVWAVCVGGVVVLCGVLGFCVPCGVGLGGGQREGPAFVLVSPPD